MIGKNIAKWLDDFIDGPADRRNLAAAKLMKISEYYFDDHKVITEERNTVVNRLSKLLSSPDPIVQECIASLLGNLQVWTVEVENILGRLLSSESDSVLLSAVWATGNLKSNAKTLVSQLLKLQHHNSREVRSSVAYALKKIGLRDETVSISLLKLAKDPDWLVRMHALEALAVCVSMPDVDAESVLVISLDDKDQAVQAAACRAIGTLNITSKAAKNKLMMMASELSDALWALSKNWPELFVNKRFRKLLEANSGYHWADELLANMQPIANAKKTWLSKLFSRS